MISALLLGAALISGIAADADSAPGAADRKAYEAAKAEAGRDADAQVRLALWCDAHGLSDLRLKHLAIAVIADPSHVKARALLGVLAFHGQWQRPDQVANRVRSDEKLAAALAEYNAKRAKTPQTADAQWKLALWCEQHDLKAEATAHLATVIRLDPTRDEAWKHLGYKKRNGRWLTDAQASAQKAETEAQHVADLHWKTTLEKLKAKLASESQRPEALAALAQVSDPRAVPAICVVFGAETAPGQIRAVQLLGQVDSPSSSRALAVLAAFGRTDEVRRRATETLRHRDPRAFADLLISLIRDKIEYEVRPVAGPGSPGELFVKGKQFNVRRLYPVPVHPYFPYIVLMPGDRLGFDTQGELMFSRQSLYETYVAPAPTGATPGNYPIASVPAVGPSLGFQNTAHGPIRPIGMLPASGLSLFPLTANYWQPLSAGFGSYDYGLASYSPINIVSVGYPNRGPGGATPSNVMPLSQGQSGALNTYFAFSYDTTIPISQMIASAGKPDPASAQKRLDQDIQILDQYNKSLDTMNNRAASILEDVSGVDLGPHREPWKEWLVNQVGYAYFAKKYDEVPTVVEDVPVYSPPAGLRTQFTPLGFYNRVSCFGAGTLVHTLSGSQPIEALAVGDQVLSQDLKTGALSYEPILLVHHNPPSKTFVIRLNGESIVSSPFHRFWKAGKGWVMARDLAVGDTIRTLQGLAQVVSMAEGEVQPVYNLDVANTGSFFVGKGGALVHDNTLPAPSLSPFDAPPELAAQKAH